MTSRWRNASFWTVLEFGGSAGIRLASNLALTRLLSPEIFGLMALARVYLDGVKMLSDVGTTASVIRSERNDEAFLQTAWTVQILRGGLIALVSCLIAWPVSRLYDQDVLFPLILVLSISPAIAGFKSISTATVSRDLVIRRRVLIDLATQLSATCITILFAWLLGSVWALVIGGLSGAMLGLVLGHVFLPPFRHGFRLERVAFQEMFGFGRWILLGTFFTYLGGNGRTALQGLLVPVEILGLLAIASLLAWAPGQFMSKLLANVVFPSLSEVRRERPEGLVGALRKVRLVTTFGFFPAFFLLSFFAQPLIEFLYDDRYAGAGPLLALMALNGALGLLGMPYGNLLLAQGRSDLHALTMFLHAGISIVGLFAGFYVFGLVGLLIGVGISSVIVFLVAMLIALRRGYATWALDLLALGIVLVFYAFTVWTLDMSLLPDISSEWLAR